MAACVTGAEKECGQTRTWNSGSLAHLASTLPPNHLINQLHFPLFNYIHPQICRDWQDSLFLVQTVSFRLLLATRAKTHTEPPNVKGAEKECGLTRTQMQGLCASFLPLELSSHGPTLATKCHKVRERMWPNRDSNPYH